MTKLSTINPLDFSFLKLKSNKNIKSKKQNELLAMSIGLDKKTLLKLIQLKNTCNIEPFLYGQAIYSLLLHKYTGQKIFYVNYSENSKKCKKYPLEFDITFYDFTKINTVIDVLSQTRESTDEIQNKDKIIYKLNINYQETLFFAEEDGKYKILCKSDSFDIQLLREFISCYKQLFMKVLDELLTIQNISKLKLVKDYSILSLPQKQRLSVEWNMTEREYIDNDKPIQKLFEKQVDISPNSTALVCAGKIMTYRELNNRSNQLANYLMNKYNIQGDDLIALCLDRNEDMLISILGVLKSGGAYVPIDPTYSDKRIAHILNDIGCKVILSNKFYKERVEKILSNEQEVSKITIINNKIIVECVDEEQLKEDLLSISNSNPEIDITSNNLAYVIYTSGTTGNPKGVMIEHLSINLTINSIKERYFKQTSCINTYSITNYVFDIFCLEYCLPIFSGGFINLAKDQYVDINCNQYDFIQMTPSLLNLTLEKLKNISNTKLFLGGEELPLILLNELIKKRIKCINLYGPSETCIWSTSKEYYIESKKDILYVSIGTPLYNEKAYVLDNNMHPLPIGAIGELYIGGSGLSRGYLNRPELTSKKFIKNPFQTKEEKLDKRYSDKGRNNKIYKTGDLVRWLPDGNLEYIGRNNSQFKIRGQRTKLSDIENTLLCYKGIKQVVVLALDHATTYVGNTDNSKYLVAYYVSNDKLNHKLIMSYLQNSLPEYMIPKTLVYLEKLPLTINGKLDKKSLLEL